MQKGARSIKKFSEIEIQLMIAASNCTNSVDVSSILMEFAKVYMMFYDNQMLSTACFSRRGTDNCKARASFKKSY